MVVISISLDMEQLSFLTEQAKNKDLPVSKMFQQCVLMYKAVNSHETAEQFRIMSLIQHLMKKRGVEMYFDIEQKKVSPETPSKKKGVQ